MRHVVVFAAMVAGFAACDGGGGDGDGDADADADEGCGEIGQACNLSTECPALQVCHEHQCGCAFDRE